MAAHHRANAVKDGAVFYSNRARPNVAVDPPAWSNFDPFLRDYIAMYSAINQGHSYFHISLDSCMRIDDQRSLLRIDSPGDMTVYPNHISEANIAREFRLSSEDWTGFLPHAQSSGTTAELAPEKTIDGQRALIVDVADDHWNPGLKTLTLLGNGNRARRYAFRTTNRLGNCVGGLGDRSRLHS